MLIWLRRCSANWKVACLISDGVIGIFRLHNHSGSTVAPGSTQPLTETRNWNISWGKDGCCVGLKILTHSHADFLEIWNPKIPGALCVCNRTVEGMLYHSFSCARPFLQTSGSHSFPYGLWFEHIKFLSGHSNIWVILNLDVKEEYQIVKTIYYQRTVYLFYDISKDTIWKLPQKDQDIWFCWDRSLKNKNYYKWRNNRKS